MKDNQQITPTFKFEVKIIFKLAIYMKVMIQNFNLCFNIIQLCNSGVINYF